MKIVVVNQLSLNATSAIIQNSKKGSQSPTTSANQVSSPYIVTNTPLSVCVCVYMHIDIYLHIYRKMSPP